MKFVVCLSILVSQNDFRSEEYDLLSIYYMLLFCDASLNTHDYPDLTEKFKPLHFFQKTL
jgi:hypothetical protein